MLTKARFFVKEKAFGKGTWFSVVRRVFNGTVSVENRPGISGPSAAELEH